MRPDLVSFVLLGSGGARGLDPLLRAVMGSPAVAGEVGFGPPLVRSSPQLIAALRTARGALDKLSAYLEHCVVDDAARVRLLASLKRQVVLQHGPVEAESVDAASERAIHLRVRLSESAAEAAEDEEATADLVSPPDDRTGRLRLLLHDATGARLLDIDDVAAAARGLVDPVAVELRVAAVSRDAFRGWLRTLEADRPGRLRWVEIGDPASHARSRRDGRAF